MNPEVAREIGAAMLDISSKLNNSLLDVRGRCSEDEFNEYRSAVAVILTDILVEVLNPLYRVHPSLKPPEMR